MARKFQKCESDTENPRDNQRKPTRREKKLARAQRTAQAFAKIQATARKLESKVANRPLRLLSKRGTRRGGIGRCSNCFTSSTVWQYETNRGYKTLCIRCKEHAFSQSFRGVDAFSRAIGSAFETNRRRH
jgi:hypothetical protein